MHDPYMSTPGNTAKLETARSNIQAAQSNPSLVGSEPTIASVRILPRQHSNPICQPGIRLFHGLDETLIDYSLQDVKFAVTNGQQNIYKKYYSI